MRKKLVIYDFEDSPLSPQFIDRASSMVAKCERVDAKADYCGALTREHLEGAEGLITRVFDHYPNDLFDVPDLRYIGSTHTDVSHFDVAFLRQRGVTLTNVPGYSTNAVAELTIGVLLGLVRHLPAAFASVSQGGWSFESFLGTELSGKTIGVVGLGRIGMRVAQLAHAFGMDVAYASRTPRPEIGYRHLDLIDVFGKCDVISIHLSLNDETRGMVDAELISRVRPASIFLCPSRTEIIDLDALYAAAKFRGLRVWLDELQDQTWRNKFRAVPNVWLTPDFGWYTREAQARLEEVVLGNLRSYLDGESENSVT